MTLAHVQLACRFSKPQAAIDMMRHIKQLFDPHGILNPYKLLPPP